MRKSSTLPRAPKERDGYEASRVFYWIESAFEYFITILSSGAFLAKLTAEVGISDSVTAILTALTSFAGVAQLVSIRLSRRKSVKWPVTVICLISQLLFAAMYLIPFLSIGAGGMTALFFAAILAARVFYIIPSPLKTTWFMNLVPMQKRGMYTALNQIISLASGAVVSFVAGYMIDKFTEKGDIETAFIVLTVTIFIFAIVHFVLSMLAKEKPADDNSASSASILDSLKRVTHNKRYMRLFAVMLLEALAAAVITPFLGTYQNSELGFSMTFISVITIIISVVGMASNFVFGRISQEVEYRTILKFSYPIMCLAYVVNIFTMPENGAVMFILYSVILRIGASATAVSQTNLILQISSREEQTAAISFFSIISGLLSFLVTMAISPFVDFMQARGNQLFGVTVYAQQILSAVAMLLYLAGALIYFFFFLPSVEERKKKKAKHEA